MRLRGMILRKDGSEAFEIAEAGPCGDAQAIGERAGAALLRKAPADILA